MPVGSSTASGCLSGRRTWRPCARTCGGWWRWWTTSRGSWGRNSRQSREIRRGSMTSSSGWTRWWSRSRTCPFTPSTKSERAPVRWTSAWDLGHRVAPVDGTGHERSMGESGPQVQRNLRMVSFIVSAFYASRGFCFRGRTSICASWPQGACRLFCGIQILFFYRIFVLSQGQQIPHACTSSPHLTILSFSQVRLPLGGGDRQIHTG
jgi:hypothetical protein